MIIKKIKSSKSIFVNIYSSRKTKQLIKSPSNSRFTKDYDNIYKQNKTI